MHYCHKDGAWFHKAGENDLRLLADLKAESWWGTHRTLIVNDEDQRRWLQAVPPDELYLIAHADTGSGWREVGVAAYTAIDHVSRSLRISGSILLQHRNPKTVRAAFVAGLDFAFEMLNVRRVEAEVLEYHLPAQKLEIELLGFTVEGRRRQAVYKCGRYWDSLVLGLLREEWEAQPRVRAYGGSCNINFDTAKMARLASRAPGAAPVA